MKPSFGYPALLYRGFVSALIGVVFGTMFVLWLIATERLQFIATLSDHRLYLVFLATALYVFLILAYPMSVRFWKRYRNTKSLKRPPVLTIELLLIFTTFFFCSTYYFLQDSDIHFQIFSEISDHYLAFWAPLLLWLLSSIAHSTYPNIPLVETKTMSPLDKGVHDDEPIVLDHQDFLDRIAFIDRFFQEITTLPFSDSFVFSLEGKWGEGKSSVINLLRTRLDKNPNLLYIEYNPWYFATEGAAIRGFYLAIENALQTKFILPGLHRILHRYSTVLTLGLQNWGLKRPNLTQPQRIRDDLEALIAHLDQRLVIAIDDIDRLRPPEILNVFRLTRLSGRVRGTIFILTYDPVIISSALKSLGQFDEGFLEKVVQKPVSLPPAEQSAINRFLLFSESVNGKPAHQSAIDTIFDRLGIDDKRRRDFDEKFHSLYSTHFWRLFRTLRQAKKYLNGIHSSLPSISGEINLYDFFLLEMVRMFYPKVHQDIWENRSYYLPSWGIEESLSRPFSSDDERYDQIGKHINKLLEEAKEPEVLKEILEELFLR